MSKVTQDMITRDIDAKFWRAVQLERVFITQVAPAGSAANQYAKEATCRPPNYNLLN